MRIECLPVQALGILAKVNIDLAQLGVDRILTKRRVAWESAVPVTVVSHPYVCIARPHLESILLTAVLNASSVRISDASPAAEHEYIDATGFSPEHGTSGLQPWVARISMLPNRASRIVPFSLASLSTGYAYCVASPAWINFAVVGPARMLPADMREVADLIGQEGQGWILQDLPPLFTWEKARGGHASFATSGLLERAIGSAAFRRDILSSHGVTSAFSDGYHAIQCVKTGIRKRLKERHFSEMQTHLKSLADVMARNRFHAETAWADYAAYIGSYIRGNANA